MSGLLLENGGNLLLEDGAAALLESVTVLPVLQTGPSRRRFLFLRRRRFLTPLSVLNLPSLPEAIVERVYSLPGIIDRLPGGFWFGTPDDQAFSHQPYGVLSWIGEQSDYVTRRKSSQETNAGPVKSGKRTTFQVTLIGPDFDILDTIHDTWEDHFHPAMNPLRIRRRLFRSLFNHDPQVDFGDVPSSPTGYNAVSYHWTLEVVTNTRPS